MNFVKIVPDDAYVFLLYVAMDLLDTGYEDILDDLTSALNGNEKNIYTFSNNDISDYIYDEVNGDKDQYDNTWYHIVDIVSDIRTNWTLKDKFKNEYTNNIIYIKEKNGIVVGYEDTYDGWVILIKKQDIDKVFNN